MSTLEVKAIQAPTGYNLQMPAGHILQTIQGGSTSVVSTATATLTTLFSQAITITASNKVLVTLCLPFAVNTDSSPGAIEISYSGDSSGTVVAEVQVADEHHASSAGFYSVQTLHTPSSGTSFTYTVKGKRVSGSGTIYWNSSDMGGSPASRASITLQEIAV